MFDLARTTASSSRRVAIPNGTATTIKYTPTTLIISGRNSRAKIRVIIDGTPIRATVAAIVSGSVLRIEGARLP